MYISQTQCMSICAACIYISHARYMYISQTQCMNICAACIYICVQIYMRIYVVTCVDANAMHELSARECVRHTAFARRSQCSYSRSMIARSSSGGGGATGILGSTTEWWRPQQLIFSPLHFLALQCSQLSASSMLPRYDLCVLSGS